ncbi:MAG: pyruvate formate-lyase-activating protein [Lachnospiraceae bacterium]|nr:pyruvate formate-lyase-activating protein [Lachnospiraceae bacterium]
MNREFNHQSEKTQGQPAPFRQKSTTGFIHSVETFGSVDGPGIRFVIFVQGCRLRCQFCHNPDTWNRRGGEPVTAEQMLDQAMKYKTYWGKKGGITVSGGEPLLQMDFLIELFTRAKEEGIHTCIDTAGQPFSRHEPFFGKFNKLMKVTDLLLLDIKHMDPDQHKRLTGCPNDNILDMARYLSDIGKPVWIRHVLVPERSDYDEYLKQLDEFVRSLKNVRRFEVLPYHTLGTFKWEELRIPYPLAGIDPPAKERVAYVNEVLHTADYRGYLED